MSSTLARNEAETVQVAVSGCGPLSAGDIVALTGELGAGKSVVARALGRAAGVVEAMPSPSFTLVCEYEAPTPVRHVDLYRLSGEAEVADLDLESERSHWLTLVEWADRSPALLAASRVRIHLETVADRPEARRVVVERRR